jgi:hypothetical protein
MRALTRICGLTAIVALLSSTPSVAAETRVRPGGDLQAAINAARPGDTILLEPGATYTGNFRLPVHGGTTYITIRSAAVDGQLPAARERISPAHASQLPKLKSGNSSPAISTVPGAAYWRLLFLELLPTEPATHDIVMLGDGSEAQDAPAKVPHHLVLDRVYIHGDPLHGQKRGIALNSGETSILNCYISGIRAIGQDSQAIAGWSGPGPYTIENNYLEAAGEVVLFGGASVPIRDQVPSDIVIRGNTFTRPLTWRDPVLTSPAGVTATAMTGGTLAAGRYSYRVVARRPAYDTTASSEPSQEATATASPNDRIVITWTPVADATEYRVYRRGSGAAGFWKVTAASFTDDGRPPSAEGQPEKATRWQVKNLLELKNARHVQIVSNVFERNWAQAQNGTAILFTPRAEGGQCPWCVVEDVTFEYNVVRGVGAGFNILGVDDYTPSRQTNNIRIRHNEFSDMTERWGGTGYFALLQRQPKDIVIDHNTIVSDGGGGIIQVDGPPIDGFTLTNNVARHNRYGIIGSGHAPGTDSIKAFFPKAVISRNVLAGGSASDYPAGNRFPSTSEFEAHFVDYAHGNFAVRPNTDWAAAGTDGLDLGAVFPDHQRR